jgi:acyl dehydratase
MSELLYFEDFHVGQAFNLGPHGMTKADILEFAHEFDWLPFHTDEEAAKKSILGGLAASGWHSASVLLRLMCDACLTRSAMMGSDGLDEVKWRSPVLVGDVLSGAMTITGSSVSHSVPDVGVLNFTSKLANQNALLKIEITGRLFVRKRTS